MGERTLKALGGTSNCLKHPTLTWLQVLASGEDPMTVSDFSAVWKELQKIKT